MAEVEVAEEFIEANRSVMMGKPVARGTRITVESLLERLAAGETVAETLRALRTLTRPALQAVEALDLQRDTQKGSTRRRDTRRGTADSERPRR
jgi:uncharacterized protein (DUF433 family)